ncbi:hypothetical protein IGI04_012457 [Brassica rapa subsp. trilocularis]|uniref:Uncharacterized protein n=1 Tax=Brassica rapa subsp. trilocularis TaxID=1813537 RepID=A0ABQ7N601_BRACM|nr:hypothetical protein IGI04_012457 [Brassica rapa subsp. trilocularis]
MYHPKKILTEITKLSSTAPTSFPFNFYSCLEDEDLIIAAERMPNIKKNCLGTKGQFKESTLNSLEKTRTILPIQPSELRTLGQSYKKIHSEDRYVYHVSESRLLHM